MRRKVKLLRGGFLLIFFPCGIMVGPQKKPGSAVTLRE